MKGGGDDDEEDGGDRSKAKGRATTVGKSSAVSRKVLKMAMGKMYREFKFMQVVKR